MKNLFGQIATRRGEVLGCDGCSLNKIRGVRKIKRLDKIKGRRAMIWAGYPSAHDNEKGIPLSGKSGQLVWRALEEQGLDRAEFDVQNVLRCRPLGNDGRERPPEKRELKCCQVYDDEAMLLNKGAADVHVILGELAGSQLLGKKLKKDTPIFWHEPWESYVLYNASPGNFLRDGEASGWDYNTWRERFRAVPAILDNPGRWGYVKSRGYKAVMSLSDFDQMEKEIKKEAALGRRASLDIEDGVVDGKRVLLLAGFGIGHFRVDKSWKSWTGKSWSVVVDHPEGKSKRSPEIEARLTKLIEDVGIKKSLQNGSYDGEHLQKFLGARLRGYDYDTQYGTFLRHSFLRSCGLENLTYLFFPEFADYKDTVECAGKGDGTFGSINYADVPLDLLVLRNSGDCDVTKRLEERFQNQISYPLLQVYINAGITLDKMEKRGPFLDWDLHKRASEAIPKMTQKLDRMLQTACNDPNFNCDSDQQVAWLVYDFLKMPVLEDKKGNKSRSTVKEVLELLYAQTGNPLLELIMKRRTIGKIKSTYLNGYAASATLNDGELRTIWWLVGAVTGRLRSGKGDRAEAKGIVNMQNLHGNPMLQNLLVSDRDWRKAMDV